MSNAIHLFLLEIQPLMYLLHKHVVTSTWSCYVIYTVHLLIIEILNNLIKYSRNERDFQHLFF